MFDPTVQTVIDRVDALREQVDDHWQIPRDEALILAQVVRLGRCISLCEVGHSYGFSTLHLAAAAKANGGHVNAFDLSRKKHEAARQHIEEAGLSDVVTFHLGDARELLRSLRPAKPYDFIFVDAVKEQSSEYLDAVLDHLAARVVITVDNTLTHGEKLSGFVARIRAMDGVTGCDVPVGNGFEFAIRHGGG